MTFDTQRERGHGMSKGNRWRLRPVGDMSEGDEGEIQGERVRETREKGLILQGDICLY